MKATVTITIHVDAPESVYAERAKAMAAIAAISDREDILPYWKREDNRVISDELRRPLAAAETRMRSMAKKLGLTLKGAPDIQYGINGNETSPMRFWYQAIAE